MLLLRLTACIASRLSAGAKFTTAVRWKYFWWVPNESVLLTCCVMGYLCGLHLLIVSLLTLSVTYIYCPGLLAHAFCSWEVPMCVGLLVCPRMFVMVWLQLTECCMCVSVCLQKPLNSTDPQSLHVIPFILSYPFFYLNSVQYKGRSERSAYKKSD